MATAQPLINQSLRVLGVIGAGETPAAEDSDIALTALNGILTSLSLQRLSIYADVLESKVLTPGQASYTIGTNGSPDWNTARPNAIIYAFIRMGVNDYPCEIVDQDTYDGYVQKSTSSNLPNRLFYDKTYPNGTIKLLPTPSQANTLYIRSMKLLESFASLSDTVDLPSGYERMLKWALARELSAEYGKQITPDIERQYMEALADIKRLNARPIVGNTIELTQGMRYNIYSDTGG